MNLNCEEATQEMIDLFIENMRSEKFVDYLLFGVEPDMSLFSLLNKHLGNTDETILIITNKKGNVLFLNTTEKTFPLVDEKLGLSWTEAYQITLTQSVKKFLRSRIESENENGYVMRTDTISEIES